MELFNSGNVREAILAFEAGVQTDPEHAEGWRMLGVCHAENDEDKKAIVCLRRAVDADPYNVDALLALGTSYVNELGEISSSPQSSSPSSLSSPTSSPATQRTPAPQSSSSSSTSSPATHAQHQHNQHQHNQHHHTNIT